MVITYSRKAMAALGDMKLIELGADNVARRQIQKALAGADSNGVGVFREKFSVDDTTFEIEFTAISNGVERDITSLSFRVD